ncbi:MAG: hypothetical protein CBB68_05505 [Rhodospirillaceae bacterium TMED8]|nr:hypothetical protein [Magnetovibrio sp.]OUT51450.1 MAG: hypothetical protein CBB68_05505 [Rhodospirillaceae bacterium TMED8]
MMSILSKTRWNLSLIPFILLLACEKTDTTVGLDGVLAVFSPNPANAVLGGTSNWVFVGNKSALDLRSIDESRTPALEVWSTQSRGAAIRRVNARLLATPFLTWRWSVGEGEPQHPIRIVIGFSNKAETEKKGMLSRVIWGNNPPSYSRTLSLIWGGSALLRGSLIRERLSQPNKIKTVRYVVRGGEENRDKWWLENLDLSRIYSIAWPDSDMAKTRIVFVGLSSTGSKIPERMRIMALRLSR